MLEKNPLGALVCKPMQLVFGRLVDVRAGNGVDHGTAAKGDEDDQEAGHCTDALCRVHREPANTLPGGVGQRQGQQQQAANGVGGHVPMFGPTQDWIEAQGQPDTAQQCDGADQDQEQEQDGEGVGGACPLPDDQQQAGEKEGQGDVVRRRRLQGIRHGR